MVTDARCLAAPGNGREIKLEPEPASVRKARVFVAEQLAELGFHRSVDDGALIASELVTNALRAAPATLLLVVRVGSGSHAIIEVHDSSPELPELQEPDLASERGRGLHIVDALSAARDTLPVAGGKVVRVVLKRD